jgi:hypothetical protein
MLKKLSCKHCVGLFQPVRTGHFYCSETCRKLAFKARNRAKTQAKRNKKLSVKLQKLANSAFGIYLIKELRRAKTVEILQGHTSETLTALVQFRRLCTAIGGYDNGNPLGYYELSHIYPVSGKDRVGLLNLANLTITTKTFNRKHGTKLPVEGYMGSSIARTSLLKEWKVADSLNALDVLKLARKYLGKEFDNWLKKHLISQTQKESILKKLKDAGFDYDLLKTMSLRELKEVANDEEVPYFSITRDPKELISVLFNELDRLDLHSDLRSALQKLMELNWFLVPSDYYFNGEPKDFQLFQEFICNQALSCIHGQVFSTEWKNEHISSFFSKANMPKEISSYIYDDDIL